MFIIWGSKHKEKRIGFIADNCPNCQQVKCFQVVEHYKVGHIYYISLGQGSLEATTMRCSSCNGEYNYNASRYALCSQSSSGQLGDLLRMTNPVLMEKIERQKRLENIAAGDSDGTPKDDVNLAKLQLHIDALNVYESEEVTAFLTRLENWNDIDQNEKDVLGREINKYIAEQKNHEKIFSFIRKMGIDFPGSAGCATFIVLMILMLSPFYWFHETHNWLYGGLLVVASLAVSITMYIKQSNKTVCKWVQDRLIPSAEQEQVNINTFAQYLVGIKQSNQKIDDDISSMISSTETICENLESIGVIDIEGW